MSRPGSRDGALRLDGVAAVPRSVGAAADPNSLVPGTVEWWHDRHTERRRRRPRAHGLTLDRIVAAALAVVDAEGIEALTVRRLADELGTASASLYRHIAGREELLILLVDHVLGGIRAPRSRLGWRQRVEWLARELRRVLLEHGNLAPSLTVTQLLGPNALRGVDMDLVALHDGGFDADAAVEIHLAVVEYVIGSVLMNSSARGRRAMQPGALAALIADLPRDTYPAVVAHADAIQRHHAERVFEVGLAALLDGLERRSPERRRSSLRGRA